MTFSEKSKKISDSKTIAVGGAYTFNEVVEKACEDLMDCQIKYSIRRIQEMENCLCDLEQELDAFLKLKK